MCEQEEITLTDETIKVIRKLGPFQAEYDIELAYDTRLLSRQGVDILNQPYIPLNQCSEKREGYVTFSENNIELFRINCTFYHNGDPSVHFYLEEGKEINRQNVLFCIYESYNTLNIYNMLQERQNDKRLLNRTMEMISTIVVPDDQPDKLVVSHWSWGPTFLCSRFDKKSLFQMNMIHEELIDKVMYRGINRITADYD